MNSIQTIFDPLSGPVQQRNRRRNPFWRFRRVLLVLVLMAIVGVGTVLYAFSQTELPEDDVADLAETSYLCTAEVTFDCGPENATAQLSTGGEDREVITYNDLPPQLIAAVVATEDQDYFNHDGVDPRGITRAAYQYFLGDGVLQGGSTITQQYVKNAFNDDEQNLNRKAREAIRAIKLEQDLAEECASLPEEERLVAEGEFDPKLCAKQEILTRYLNRIYFGRGASGVQAAAQAYFDKDVGEVTVGESAFLAGLLRAPEGADPDEDLDEAIRRRGISIDLMVEAGYLTIEEGEAAENEPWNHVAEPDREGLGEVKGADWGSEYFVEEARQQLDELFPSGEIYTRGLRVYTTLDQDLQRMAYESAHLPKPDEDLTTRDFPEMGPLFLDPNNPNDPDASIVSIDAAGRVVAMLGGTNFAEDEFNLATSSGTPGRQPGSTFKTLGLALAIEQGISAKSFYPAVPGVTSIGAPCADSDGPWQVTGGSSARYRYRDLVESLKWSSNVVYAQLVVQITPNALADFAGEMGVTSELTDGGIAPCSLILGGKGVPVVDMAAAYSVFERNGQRLDPILIERVEDANGNVICWYPNNGACFNNPGDRQPTQVIAESTALQVKYAMNEVTNGGTGRRAVFDPERAVIGKTGTSQESRDGWFAGMTCGMTTVVWLGYAAEETPMYDFRKPLAEGETEKPRNEAGELIDDRGWPNIEGGNFPTMIWADYMAKATANLPPCPEIEMSDEFEGTRLNQELSTTTLPPCGVQLDDFGYPIGSGPDDFVLITTTQAPPPNSGDGDNPDGLPVQDGDNPNSSAACVPIGEWALQTDPNATFTPVQPDDSNNTTTVAEEPTESTQPGEPTTSPPPGETTATTQPSATEPTLVLPTTSGEPTTTADE